MTFYAILEFKIHKKLIFYKVEALKNDIDWIEYEHLESKYHFERKHDNFCPIYRISNLNNFPPLYNFCKKNVI